MNLQKIESYYKVRPETGLIDAGAYIPSPNCDSRPNGQAPELIVVHNISLPPNQFGGSQITQLFTNCLNPEEDPFFREIEGLRVSAHLLIRRDGSMIQYVPFNQRAWHAGLSCYKERSACNDFSIGIELEGSDHTSFTMSQYLSLSEVIKALWLVYPSLSEHNVVGHSDIAPGRKTDPGPYFMWASLNRLLES
ncbi:MAG: N-acetyl-anhydromuramoyl-L-alanine amidase [Thiomicrorhabdus sp.]|nr:MAG: N-acetyl-anhydromuramoyl-L-alanine amidase [Thiomicrorhabdus sp.]